MTAWEISGETWTSNIHILDDATCDIFGMRFIGSTMWSHATRRSGRDNSISPFVASYSISDFRHIRDWTPQTCADACAKSLEWISRQITESPTPCIVVTHYVPGRRFLYASVSDHPLNNFFVSDAGKLGLVDSEKVLLWAYGHTHSAVTMRTDSGGLTVCNPYGYAHERECKRCASGTMNGEETDGHAGINTLTCRIVIDSITTDGNVDALKTTPSHPPASPSNPTPASPTNPTRRENKTNTVVPIDRHHSQGHGLSDDEPISQDVVHEYTPKPLDATIALVFGTRIYGHTHRLFAQNYDCQSTPIELAALFVLIEISVAVGVDAWSDAAIEKASIAFGQEAKVKFARIMRGDAFADAFADAFRTTLGLNDEAHKRLEEKYNIHRMKQLARLGLST